MRKSFPPSRRFIAPAVITAILFFAFFSSCKKEYSCENCLPQNGSSNKAPVAIAGADQTITLPLDSTTLVGTASYDPDGTIEDYQWKKISGPSGGTIVHIDSASTRIKSLVLGVYKFELTVKDNGGSTAKDTVQLIVKDPLVKMPPVAVAGNDQTIVLPTDSALLDGLASTDPDGVITSYLWTAIAGPTGATFDNPLSGQTKVRNLVAGIYQFKLTVTDNDNLSSSSILKITVVQVGTAAGCTGRPVIPVQLQQIGNLSIGGAELACAHAGGKIAFAGGQRQGGYSTRVDIYDINTNSWTTAELSNPYRQGVAAVSVGTRIIFAGGGDNNTGIFTTRVDIYDVATNTWSTAELSQAREYLAATTVGNKVMFAGGGIWAPYLTGSNVVDIYDANTNSWSTASLSAGRLSLSATTVGNKAYFAGGLLSAYPFVSSSRIDIYDATTNTWSTAEMQKPRGAHASIYAGGRIFWGSGSTNDPVTGPGVLNEVEMYDPASGNTSIACMIPRSFLSAVASGDQIVFFTGDLNNSTLAANKIEIYNTTTNTWKTGLLDQSIMYSAIISVNNTVYVAGGVSNYNGTLSSKVWKLIF